MNNEWIDLDIRNIPRDFFVNKDYDIQRLNLDDNKYHYTIYSEPEYRHNIIYLIRKDEGIYRYRLKPKTIKIEIELIDGCCDCCVFNRNYCTDIKDVDCDGCKCFKVIKELEE